MSPLLVARPEGQRVPPGRPANAGGPNVEILGINLLHPDESSSSPERRNRALRAYADLRVGRVVIRHVRILRHEDGALWCQMPLRSWTESGRRMRSPLVELPQKWQDAVESVVIAAYRAKIGGAA